MAINKNFVIKNGLEVDTNLIVADSAGNKVGIGITNPAYTLHVFGGGTGGGIGATALNVTGVATINNLSVTGISTFSGGTNFTAGGEFNRIRITGVSTIGFATAGQLYVSGISTLNDTTAATLVVTGFTTLGAISAGNVFLAGITTGLNVPGIGTLGFVQHTTLNVTGFTTLGAISAGNVFLAGITTGLNVPGISTLGFVQHTTLNVTGFTTLGAASGANLSVTGFTTLGAASAASLSVTGIVTATGGVKGIGIQSAGSVITSGTITALNFVGSGNTFSVDGTTVNISIAGGGGKGGFSTHLAGIATISSLGINTSNLDDPDLTGIGNSFQGLYIGNGMMIVDNQLNGNHYIGTAFNGLMAGPVTINGTLTIDGNYVVV